MQIDTCEVHSVFILIILRLLLGLLRPLRSSFHLFDVQLVCSPLIGRGSMFPTACMHGTLEFFFTVVVLQALFPLWFGTCLLPYDAIVASWRSMSLQ